MSYNPEFNRILVETGVDSHALTPKILKALSKVPISHKKDNIYYEEEGMPDDMGKKSLCLITFKGDFLKLCPGTQGYICCGYKILNIGTNCPMDCSYCILQAYVNQPFIRIFTNLDEELTKVGKILDINPDKIFRIGTGEFTDSIALDHITGFNKILIKFFQNRKNAILELKTKTDRIDELLALPERERIILSWSLNSPFIASKEEHGASSVKKRIVAASRCQSDGFVIGFHFDPLIQYENWREGYLKTLDLLDRYINPNGIIWISMGCLRYMPALKPIIRRRHPQTHILDGEFIRGIDGKMRYFKPIRIEMYSFLNNIFQQWGAGQSVYLCMESDEIWEKSLGWSPRNSLGLSNFLDDRVNLFFKK